MHSSRVSLAAATIGLGLCACGSTEDLQLGAGGASSTTTSAETATTATSSTSATSATTGVGGAGGGATTGTGGSEIHGFPPSWPDGLDCGSEGDILVWSYDDDTFILRQSLCTDFEGPFLYLLFGEDKVLLQDTGTGDADVAGAVSVVITDWLARNGKSSIDLLVTHSHGHGDHVGGDGQFSGLANTTVVGKSQSSVEAFFGIDDWPNQTVTLDLGNRVLDVIPIPGHQQAHVALYDRRNQLLLTGDTLYPGRLYVEDWSSYKASVHRLVDFVETGSPVTWVLGTHIEMDTTGDDYAMGANKHPNEHPLQLGYDQLVELQSAVDAMGNNPQYDAHPHFIVYPL